MAVSTLKNKVKIPNLRWKIANYYIYVYILKAVWYMGRLGDWKICFLDLILPLFYLVSFESHFTSTPNLQFLHLWNKYPKVQGNDTCSVSLVALIWWLSDQGHVKLLCKLLIQAFDILARSFKLRSKNWYLFYLYGFCSGLETYRINSVDSLYWMFS